MHGDHDSGPDANRPDARKDVLAEDCLADTDTGRCLVDREGKPWRCDRRLRSRRHHTTSDLRSICVRVSAGESTLVAAFAVVVQRTIISALQPFWFHVAYKG